MAVNNSFETFKASLRGNLFRPGEEGYEAKRKFYNGMIDKRPRLIARCADVATSSGKNYIHLVSVKKTYDPANFFRVNQNIQPAE